jgi:NitT/TauT family transport system substrate-binding protein
MDGSGWVEARAEQDRGGRFAPGISGNPAGKRQWTRNRAIILAEALAAEKEAGIARVVIDEALSGALGACISPANTRSRDDIRRHPLAGAPDIPLDGGGECGRHAGRLHFTCNSRPSGRIRSTVARRLLLAMTMLLGALALAPAARAATKIGLLFSPTTGLLPSYVAKDQGIFLKHGLDVELTLLVNQGSVVAALVSDSVQIGTPSALAVLQAVDAGLDVVFLASSNVTPSASRTAMFARNGSGIEGPHDLIGKTVGVPSLNTYLHVMARQWLKHNGVDYAKVNFVEVGFQQMADVLKGGSVDAVDAIDPYYDRVAAVGHAIGNPDESAPPGTLTSVYTATRAWAAANPGVVAAFRQSLEEAQAFIAANEAAARESLGRWTRQPASVVATTPMPNLAVTIRPAQIEFFIALAREQGLISRDPDAASLIAP